jgi:hypothetical protein
VYNGNRGCFRSKSEPTGEGFMIQLNLSETEKQILIETLQSDVNDLAYEIGNTDLLSFRNLLRERRRVLGEIIQELEKSH